MLLTNYSRINRHATRMAAAPLFVAVFLLCQSVLGQQPAPAPHAQQYTNFALERIDRVEANLPEVTRVAELMAKRHLAGGAIGFIGGWYVGSGLHSELEGRSGGLINIGFDRVWTKERPAEQKANDMAIVGWDNGPWNNDLEQIQKLRGAGTFVIGFGSRNLPGMAERVAAVDAWFDTDDKGANEKAGESQQPASYTTSGRSRLLVNMLHGWALTAEFVSALTRQGKMPPMWKSFMYADGGKWADKYFLKIQFHDDFKIAPIPAGRLAKEYFTAIRDNIKWFARTQLAAVQNAANLIAAEAAAGRQTMVATAGHAPPMFTGNYDDKVWVSKSTEINTPEEYLKNTPDNALVLRLGYTGMSREEMTTAAQKKQRVIWISSQNPNENRKVPPDLPNFIDMGWAYGDAAVAIEGYPIKILPLSGIMQVIAYESINLEVLARLAATPKK